MFEHFAHEADVGVRGYGHTKAEAFAEAARALTAAIVPPETVECREGVPISCNEADAELLLVDWLNAIVYAMATRHMLFARYDVHITGSQLTGTAWGEPVDPARHQPAVEVKGATYTALKVAFQDDGTWLAQSVVDV